MFYYILTFIENYIKYFSTLLLFQDIKLIQAMFDAEKFLDGKLNVEQQGLQQGVVVGGDCTPNCTPKEARKGRATMGRATKGRATVAARMPSTLPLVKSPNCVCCGTSTVLSGLYAIFGTMSVCVFIFIVFFFGRSLYQSKNIFYFYFYI